METLTATVLVDRGGEMLGRLWRGLVVWLRRRQGIQCIATAMDVASEVVYRATRRFFFDLLSVRIGWADLWRWSLRAARNVLTDRLRAARRERCDRAFPVEELVAGAEQASDDAPAIRCERIVADLLAVLKAPEQETLRLIAAGVHSNEEIAQLRGVTVRAVQKSRRRLLEAAQARKECRAVRPRTFVPV